jgi:pimeloyl-ACP methyl ester carboxylesterase
VEELRANSPHASDEILFRLASFALEERNDGKFYRRCDREVYGRFDSYDERESLRRISCPALVIRGAHSRVLRREVAEEMASMLPRGAFAEIPFANHPVHLDNPEAFAKVVKDFLQTLGPGSR